MSDVGVNRADGTPVAEGWLDFIHGGGDAPLFFFGSCSGFAKEMLGVRSRVKQRSPGMSGSDCRTTAEMSVRLKQHTTPDGPRVGHRWVKRATIAAVILLALCLFLVGLDCLVAGPTCGCAVIVGRSRGLAVVHCGSARVP